MLEPLEGFSVMAASQFQLAADEYVVAQEVEEETCILDSYIDQNTDASQKPIETAITETGFPLQVTQQVSDGGFIKTSFRVIQRAMRM